MYQEASMEDSVTVRDAVSEDALGIMELHNLVIEEGLLAWSEPRTEDLTLAWLDSLDKLNYPVLVALREDRVIGCGAFEPVWDTRADAGCMYSATLHIVVCCDQRKNGLASRPFDSLCSHKRSVERKLYRIACNVLSNNKAAILWLYAIEFHHCGSLEGIAEKDGKSYNLEHFSKFISSSPKVADLGFPDSAEPSPYPSQEFTLPIDPKSVSIRNATMDDLPAIVGILNSAILYTDAIDYSIPLQVSERVEWLSELLAADLPCLVALIDGVVVGYICLSAFSPEPCFDRTLDVSVYLRQELKRQRIGQQLWLAALQHPAIKRRGIKTIIALVHHNNGPGSGSVLKSGFKHQVSVSRDFFKHGEMQSHSIFSYSL